MATIRRDSDWEHLQTVKKGNIGEDIVRTLFEKRGYIIYPPVTNGPHLIDMYAEKDKDYVIAIDVKTKAARNNYPDTGIDIRNYVKYKALSDKHNMEVYIFFVDEHSKSIYGNKLSNLDMPRIVSHNGRELHYPMEWNGIRYYPLSCMKTIARISDSDAAELKALSSRNYGYCN